MVFLCISGAVFNRADFFGWFYRKYFTSKPGALSASTVQVSDLEAGG
jgi:hypothetical protein